MIIDITRIFPDSLMRIFFETVLWSILFRSFTKQKINKFIVFAIMLLLPYGIISLITVFWGYPNGFGGVILFLCFFICFILFYEGRTLQKILYYFISFALYCFITLISTYILDALYPNIFYTANSNIITNEYTLFSFLANYITPIIISFPANCIIRFFFKHKNSNLISKYTAGYLLMPFSQISIIFFASAILQELSNYGIKIDENADYKFHIPISLMFAFSLLADWYIFSMVDKTESSNKKILELMARNKQNEIEYHSIKQAEKDNNALRKMRHDIINQNMALSILLQNGKTEDAVKMLDSLEDKIEDITPKSYCSNNLINAILQLENSKAEKAGVSLNISASCSEQLSILSDTDICSLITNVADNAIEAAEGSKVNKKQVELIIKTANKMLFIHTENPFEITSKDKSGFFKSSKKDKDRHGLGLQIIKSIVKKYQGNIKYSINDNIFSLDISIALSNSA